MKQRRIYWKTAQDRDLDVKDEVLGNPETGPDGGKTDGQSSETGPDDGIDKDNSKKKEVNLMDPQKKLDEKLRDQVSGLHKQIHAHREKKLAEQKPNSAREKLLHHQNRDERRHKLFEQQENWAKERIMRDRHSEIDDGVYDKKDQQNLLHYEIGFRVVYGLSMGSYFAGGLFMVIGIVAVTYLLLLLSQRASGKGRREL